MRKGRLLGVVLWTLALLGPPLPARADGTVVQPEPGLYYYVLRLLGRSNAGATVSGDLARGIYSGDLRVTLRPNSEYELYTLKVSFRDGAQGANFTSVNRVGYLRFRTGPDGQLLNLAPVPQRNLTNAHDTDGDGLADLSEWIVGSDPQNPDSDADGVPDGVELIEGRSIIATDLERTGIVASLDTPGSATDLVVDDDLAVICDGDNGLVCATVFNGLPPRIVARVDTQGSARQAAVSGRLVAVADGPGGLAVIDITDPPAARIVRSVPSLTLGGEAQAVVTAADLAFVGLSTGSVVTVDLVTGGVVERLAVVAGPVRDMAIAGDAIYVLGIDRLYALPLRPGQLMVAGSAPAPAPASRVSIGPGAAYVTHLTGAATFGLTDPLAPQPIAPGATPQRWFDFVPNGSGVGLACVTPAFQVTPALDVSLYDARDPAQPDVFLNTFETPGAALAVAIYNGLGYVADREAGLQVLRYLPIDRAGIAPTVSLSTSGPRVDLAEEGQLLRLTATAQDDVQVRNVETWVDGVLVRTDGAFPFDHYLVTPRRDVRPSITVRLRASDTNGRATWSDPVEIQLTPDATPPAVLSRVPREGSALGEAGGVAAFLSELLDPATLGPTSFTLLEAGPDRVRGTSDDVALVGVIEQREAVRGVFLTVAGGLPAGRYRATLSGAADRAGNPLPATAWDFLVYGGAGSDRDGDTLPDELELQLGLDPDRTGSDNDGVPDQQEDFDLDGVPNGVELTLLFDLTSPDSDANGVLDRLEDRDFDRLTDANEVQRVPPTSPFDPDHDRDGFSDGDEVASASDPSDPLSVPIRALTAQLGLRSDLDPQLSQGRALVQVAVRSQASPEASEGRAIVQVAVSNEGAPEQVAGTTQAPVASVQNQSP